MVIRKFGFSLLMLCCLPLLANAEVYKWRDKDGSIKYSDTPPPSNVKIESVGKKSVKPTQAAPVNAAGAPPPLSGAAPKGDAPPVNSENAKDPAEQAAKLKHRNDEIEKKNKAEKEAQAKLKAENCKAAKANYEMLKQGGRIARVNEKGEREFLDDKQMENDMSEAQKQMKLNCS